MNIQSNKIPQSDFDQISISISNDKKLREFVDQFGELDFEADFIAKVGRSREIYYFEKLSMSKFD